MTVRAIDPTLIFLSDHPLMDDGRHLTPEECIAINIFRRDGVRAAILAQVFDVAKNTIYYSALTGKAKSYPKSPKTNTGHRIDAVVEQMGLEEARKRFVTQDMTDAVRVAVEADIERKKLARLQAARNRALIRGK